MLKDLYNLSVKNMKSYSYYVHSDLKKHTEVQNICSSALLLIGLLYLCYFDKLVTFFVILE